MRLRLADETIDYLSSEVTGYIEELIELRLKIEEYESNSELAEHEMVSIQVGLEDVARHCSSLSSVFKTLRMGV